ncbi:unnamed protein product [Colletotrichum noveboracense]|uniref:Asparaginase n=1 Tax=Colletotrichum noveboracense TaxID=2664923 RepID=A0A9W4S5J6_9PEZI|nr:unnamed protein product [Colletotrichum noveboracense]
MGTAVGIVLHGGASESWVGDDALYAATKTFLDDLVKRGEDRLRQGAEAVDAVTEVVAELEDFPEFNSGKGAAVTQEGLHELEAGIVNGSTATYRAAVCLKNTKNPIKLVRAMLHQGGTNTPVFMAGGGADELSASLGLDMVPNSFFATKRRMSYWSNRRSEVSEHGTVGAVVLDSHGNLAAANSTGGMMFKPSGRVGDTAILGSGLYADERVAVVCGGGESIITSMLASRVATLYHNGAVLEKAVEMAMWNATSICPAISCGVIAIASDGTQTAQCNSRIFTTASTGPGPGCGFGAGLLACTMPISAPLCFYEDDIVRAGVSKHPSRPNQLTFRLKDTSLAEMGEGQVAHLFWSLRRVSKTLASLCGVDDVAMVTFPSGNGGHLNERVGRKQKFVQSPCRDGANSWGCYPGGDPGERWDGSCLSRSLLLAPKADFQDLVAGIWSALERGQRVALQEPLRWSVIAHPPTGRDVTVLGFALSEPHWPSPPPFQTAHTGHRELTSALGPRVTDLEPLWAIAGRLRNSMLGRQM